MKTFSFDASGNLTVKQEAQQIDLYTGQAVTVVTAWDIPPTQLGRHMPWLMPDMDAATLAQAQAIAAANP